MAEGVSVITWLSLEGRQSLPALNESPSSQNLLWIEAPSLSLTQREPAGLGVVPGAQCIRRSQTWRRLFIYRLYCQPLTPLQEVTDCVLSQSYAFMKDSDSPLMSSSLFIDSSIQLDRYKDFSFKRWSFTEWYGKIEFPWQFWGGILRVCVSIGTYSISAIFKQILLLVI